MQDTSSVVKSLQVQRLPHAAAISKPHPCRKNTKNENIYNYGFHWEKIWRIQTTEKPKVSYLLRKINLYDHNGLKEMKKQGHFNRMKAKASWRETLRLTLSEHRPDRQFARPILIETDNLWVHHGRMGCRILEHVKIGSIAWFWLHFQNLMGF